MDRRGPRAASDDDLLSPPGGTFSRWHQVASDEVWHLYEGGPLELLELSASGQSVPRLTGWPQSAAEQTRRFARSAPGFGKQRGRWVNTRSSAAQLARGLNFADFRLLADDHDVRCCAPRGIARSGDAHLISKAWPPLGRLHFCFAAAYWLDHQLLEMPPEKSPSQLSFRS